MSHPPFLRHGKALIAVLLLASCTAQASDGGDDSASGGSSGEARTPDVRLPVTAARVRDGDLILHVTTSGRVRSAAQSELRAEVTGTVRDVLVKPGERVKSGQVLVRFDPRPFDLAVREAEANLAQARQRYEEQILPDSLATGKSPGETRRRAVRISSGVDLAQVQLDRAQLDLERATIVAPFAGVVGIIEVSRGERISQGEPITTVVDTHDLWVDVSVLEHDLPLIKVGAVAEVAGAAAPDQPAIGRVIAVLPSVDTTAHAGRAVVRVSGSSPLLPGMYADVRLEGTRLKDRLLVPSGSIIERNGRPLVFVIKEDRAQWTYINPGRSNGVDTEVLPDTLTGVIPVAAGDQVITSGHLTLTHDAPVRVVASRESDSGS
jgi:HlyD family secretion protein